MAIPDDYLHRVYAGVLGKLIGVYLGRPFENWTFQEIQERLGDIEYYVHDKLGVPLVVIDDDVSGTFAFIRALEEHGARELTSEEIGKTWLNQVIERRSIFWWGGNGISTEHTTYLNLKKGIPAPQSGSAGTNGLTMAEQIGAQIFIDGWAMVAPGNPALAVRLAEAAAGVSHDGEAVNAAKLWAAMEAEAFISKDIDHLIETGLSFIPSESLIAKMIADVRQWARDDPNDWKCTRQKIEDNYGYDRYAGICHVIPNHAIMIMTLLYGGHDFHKAMSIINTAGWDTDCNSGNVGCLVALMNGLAGFEGGPDWLGPLADRAILSTADGGYSINNAARIAYDIANFGQRLADQPDLPPPKDAAQFHFSLPGSVQGFRATKSHGDVEVRQCQDGNVPSLGIDMAGLNKTDNPVEVMTETFTPLDVLQVDRNYELMASPLVYPGQHVKAEVHAAGTNVADLSVCLRIYAYNEDDELVPTDGEKVKLSPDQAGSLEWTIPQSLQGRPIQQIGVAIKPAEPDQPCQASLFLHSLRWDGTPNLSLRRPKNRSQSFWRRAWVSSVDKMHTDMGPSFFIAHDHGEGIMYQGTREWTDYAVDVTNFIVHFGGSMGVAARVQGLNRYYAVMFTNDKRVALVKARDEKRIELASKPFAWKHDAKYSVHLSLRRSQIIAKVGDVRLQAEDGDYSGGAAGLVVTDGSLSADSIAISPVEG